MKNLTKSDLLTTAKQLVKTHLHECNLTNEGVICAYTIDSTKQLLTVVNDGYKCNILLDEVFIYGEDLVIS